MDSPNLPSGIDRMPNEMLDKIVKYFTGPTCLVRGADPYEVETLLACCLVNKRLRQVTLRHAWRSVTCIAKLGRCTDAFRHHIDFFHSKPELAALVHELVVKGKAVEDHIVKDHPEIASCELAQLVNAFPNLTGFSVAELDLQPCVHRSTEVAALHAHLDKPNPPFHTIAFHAVDAPTSWRAWQHLASAPSIRTAYVSNVTTPTTPDVYGRYRPISIPVPRGITAYYAVGVTKEQVDGIAQLDVVKVLYLYRTGYGLGSSLREIFKKNSESLEAVLLGSYGRHLDVDWTDLKLRDCVKITTFTFESLGMINDMYAFELERRTMDMLIPQVPKSVKRFRWLCPSWYPPSTLQLTRLLFLYRWDKLAAMLLEAAPYVNQFKIQLDRPWVDTRGYWEHASLLTDSIKTKLAEGGYRGEVIFEATLGSGVMAMF